jgi:hypothetical protein
MGAVLMNAETGAVWELNEVGAEVWTSLAANDPLDAILEAILRKYRAERLVAEADLLALISSLSSGGLIEVNK